MKFRFTLAPLLVFPVSALAAQSAPIQPVAGMLKMFVVLTIVLGMLVLVAWLLKRFSVQQKIPGGAIKVVAGTAVGPRERVVLVEVGETWLVVGVAPGHVSALHSMPKVDVVETGEPSAPDKGFAPWLKQVLDKRNARP